MATLYKLTTQDFKTRAGFDNECTWGEGVTHSGTGKGNLCGPGYIHAYTHPLLAVLLNSIHANLQNPVLWECAGEVAHNDQGLKVGCVTLTTFRRIPLPEVTTEQRIRFAILCAMKVYSEPRFVKWATAWLNGSDRSADAAYAAFATDAARYAYAANAARYAVSAARYADAADAADAAHDELVAEADAADAAVYAAGYAALDLIALAEQAVS